jgi:hypothetical protein
MTRVRIEFKNKDSPRTHDNVKAVEIVSGFFLITFDKNEYGLLSTYFPQDIVSKIEVTE